MPKVVIQIDFKKLDKVVNEITSFEQKFKDKIWNAYRRVGDNAARRMRRKVSGKQPYGTGYPGIPPVVKRRGRIFDTIGFRRLRDKNLLTLQAGSVRGSSFGQMLARVHDDGQVIFGKPLLVFPPFGSPARNPSTGEQIMTVSEAKKQFYSMFNTDHAIFIKRSSWRDEPELAFVKAESVEIPARKIISGDRENIDRDIGQRLERIVDESL